MANKDTDNKSEEKSLTDIKKIVIDFTRDILVTFPEQKTTLHPDLQALLHNENENNDADTDTSASEAGPDTNASAA